MSKARYVVGQDVNGMEILEILKQSPRWETVKYRVRFSCKHIEDVSGRAIMQRKYGMSIGRSTNLCRECARIEGNRRTCKTRYKKFPKPSSSQKPSMTPQDALMSFGGPRR